MKNLKLILVVIGLILAVIGGIWLYSEINQGKINLYALAIFLLGVGFSFRIIVKTKYEKKKFKIDKFN